MPSTAVPAAEVGARVRACFAGQCAVLGLRATLDGDALALRPRFEPWLGIDDAAQRDVLLAELRGRGVHLGADWHCVPLQARELEHFCAVLREALRSVRATLVKRTAWVGTGRPYVFAGGPPLVRTRGLAVYRFPAEAPAEIEFTPGIVTVTFAAGDLGDITSAGFFVPTGLAGDYDLRLRYEWRATAAGTAPACVGLMASDGPGTRASYAQVVLAADGRLRAYASFPDAPARGPGVPAAARGELRLRRDRGLVFAWHRGGEPWTCLGRQRETDPAPVLAGAKLWGHGPNGRLAVTLSDLRIDAEPDGTQGELPPPSRDPLDEAFAG